MTTTPTRRSTRMPLRVSATVELVSLAILVGNRATADPPGAPDRGAERDERICRATAESCRKPSNNPREF
ncbi:hypothetical protein HNR02_003496 [Amycolatopsis endophytica]|uniref:Uncharacterized protein n=1 Tax=Amycolatopsis endophytica TaxID=860233 RepID=A0A853B4N8_9PSEU|nr:hypothetical protein [Amycolatopsis endophytica]NYI90173.1 hypothetical protein [Amycolatopsis endophytica]